MGYSAQPQGIEGTWIPSFTGFSADPTDIVANYILVGNLCTVEIGMTGGTSNATTFTMTLPFAANATIIHTMGGGVDNGVQITTTPRMDTVAGSNIGTCYKTASTSGTWTAANGKAIRGSFSYIIQ